MGGRIPLPVATLINQVNVLHGNWKITFDIRNG